jgi:hypothetical protein
VRAEAFVIRNRLAPTLGRDSHTICMDRQTASIEVETKWLAMTNGTEVGLFGGTDWTTPATGCNRHEMMKGGANKTL